MLLKMPGELRGDFQTHRWPYIWEDNEHRVVSIPQAYTLKRFLLFNWDLTICLLVVVKISVPRAIPMNYMCILICMTHILFYWLTDVLLSLVCLFIYLLCCCWMSSV
jgi:hypothetical protein